jgi:NAD+ synthase/NAD+ synthase (glutamine-hydrolysing)
LAVVLLRVALLQINTTPGDLAGNAGRIIEGAARARKLNAELVVTTELALMGYLPRDLLLSAGFVRQSREMLTQIALATAGGPALLVGVATPNDADTGRPLFNSAVMLEHSRVGQAFHKTLLPTYDVFDEDRYFEPATGPQVLDWHGHRLGISICEDVWNDRNFWQRRRYQQDPIETLVAAGAQAILNLSASPFWVGKQLLRQDMLSHMARRHGLPLVVVNQVGGNDDLLFDGRSCAFDGDGRMFARARGFEEDLVVVDLDAGAGEIAEDDFTAEAEIWNALAMGVRDYARKTNFPRALLGLSGGIDSALTAAIASEALGPENVLGVLMPSLYSSSGSVDDSLELAHNLGIRTMTLPISGIMQTYDAVLAEPFCKLPRDVTEENIQSRIRGNLLMALSNKFGSLLLTTGNKSELAVGYCTLYGDMNGGLAVIADLPKMMVYRVARWRNQRRHDIPDSIFTKPPSAELRPNQTDQDSLPPYELLDQILELHVEQSKSAEEIVAQGFAEDDVRRVLRLVRLAEFKRKQAAPVLKVTSRAFGTGWRMPIARGTAVESATAAVPGGSNPVLTIENFVRIQKFILAQGNRMTYCTRFSNNPYWAFPGFNAYLNPPNQRNIDCQIGESEFNTLVIQVTGPSTNYWEVILDEAREELRVQQYYSMKEPRILIQEAAHFFEKALAEIAWQTSHGEPQKQVPAAG